MDFRDDQLYCWYFWDPQFAHHNFGRSDTEYLHPVPVELNNKKHLFLRSVASALRASIQSCPHQWPYQLHRRDTQNELYQAIQQQEIVWMKKRIDLLPYSCPMHFELRIKIYRTEMKYSQYLRQSLMCPFRYAIQHVLTHQNFVCILRPLHKRDATRKGF